VTLLLSSELRESVAETKRKGIKRKLRENEDLFFDVKLPLLEYKKGEK